MDKEKNLQFRRRLRRAQLAKGWGAVEAAERMRISPTTLKAWEEGRTIPRAAKIAQAARALEVAPSWLDGTDPDPESETDVPGFVELLPGFPMVPRQPDVGSEIDATLRALRQTAQRASDYLHLVERRVKALEEMEKMEGG